MALSGLALIVPFKRQKVVYFGVLIFTGPPGRLDTFRERGERALGMARGRARLGIYLALQPIHETCMRSSACACDFPYGSRFFPWLPFFFVWRVQARIGVLISGVAVHIHQCATPIFSLDIKRHR